MAEKELVLEGIDLDLRAVDPLAVGERRRGQSADHGLRGRLPDPERLEEQLSAGDRQGPVPGHVLRPSARMESAQKADRLRNGEPSGRIVGAAPVVLEPKARAI